MLRKIAIFLLLLIFVQLLPAPSAAAYVPFRNLAAVSAILIEVETETVLFEQNARASRPADALARTMTVLIATQAIERGDIRDNELIEMTYYAWEGLYEEHNTLGILPGESISFIDLIHASLLGNANEASNMIALRVGGSIEAFVSMMNTQASELGLLNTRFTNPNGQHDARQTTTAYDQFLLFREAISSPLFFEVSSTFRHTIESIDEEIPTRTITNSNSLINQGSVYFYRHALAGVDSATFEGGRSIVASAQEDGMSLIAVVLGAGEVLLDDGSVDLQNFTEATRLFHWGYDNFGFRDILRTTDLLARIPIMHGSGADFINARPVSSLTLLLNNAVPIEAFTKDVTVYSEVNDEPLVAPINAGEVLGEVVITREGTEYARMPIVANTTIELHIVEFIRRQLADLLASTAARNIFIILGAVLALYLTLLIRYHVIRANRSRRIRNARDELIRERHENFRE